MLACRLCLATDIRLYDINTTYNLKTAYETITGSQISKEDSLPQHICSYCSIMLVKCSSFREKCCYTQEMLKYLIGNQKEITQNHITSIQQSNPIKRFVTLSRSDTLPLIEIEYKEPIENVAVPVPIKEGYDLDLDSLVKIEECLAEKKVEKTIHKVKKTKKKKKKLDDFKIEPDLCSTEIDNPGNADDDYDSDRDQDNHIEMNEESVEDLKEAKLIILSLEEQYQELEARKTSANYIKSKYQCHRCFRGFISETTFNNHLMKHDPKSGDHECIVCGVRLAELRLLRAHVIAAHARKFQCTLCDHVSRSAYRAKEHYEWHIGSKFKCKLCDATFGNVSTYEAHVRRNHPARYACAHCGYTFVSKRGLNMHVSKRHRSDGEVPLLGSFCDVCEKQFVSEEAFDRHLEMSSLHNSGNTLKQPNAPKKINTMARRVEKQKRQLTYPCEECGLELTKRNYIKHFRSAHSGKQSKRFNLKSVQCKLCSKTFNSRPYLYVHMQTHREPRYRCECGKQFYFVNNYKMHRATHLPRELRTTHACHLCDTTFTQKQNLQRHLAVTHPGLKPFPCDVCGKSYTAKSVLQGHINHVHLKIPRPPRERRRPRGRAHEKRGPDSKKEAPIKVTDHEHADEAQTKKYRAS